MNPYSQVETGEAYEVTINQANTAQPLSPVHKLVASVLVTGGSVQAGNVLMGYGSTNCVLRALSLAARPGKWIDLAQVYIKSDSAGDKVAVQAISNY